MRRLFAVLVLAGGFAALWGQTRTLAAAREEVTYYGDQAWLGVGLADLTPSATSSLHLGSENGAEVVEVYADSPAAAAGLKVNDVITAFNQETVVSVRQLERLVNETPSGRTVPIRVLRADKPMELQVSLAARPSRGMGLSYGHWGTLSPAPRLMLTTPMPPMPPMPPIPPMPPMPPMAAMAPMPPTPPRTAISPGFLVRGYEWGGAGADLGIAVESLTPQLASFFGLREGQRGLLVRSVDPDSVGAKAGFQAGDVLTRLGGSEIASLADFRGAVGNHLGAPAPATVLRRGKLTTLQVQIPTSR